MTDATESKSVAIPSTKIHKCVKALDLGDARIGKDACEYLTDYVNAAVKALAKESFEWAKNSGRHTIKIEDVKNAIPRYKVVGFEE